MTQKTYEQLREENDAENLNEFRIIRSGAVLAFASKVRQQGQRLERRMQAAQSEFQKAKREEETNDKIDKFLGGLEELTKGISDMRFMMGNMTGITVSSALLAERSNKEIIKLTRKGKR